MVGVPYQSIVAQSPARKDLRNAGARPASPVMLQSSRPRGAVRFRGDRQRKPLRQERGEREDHGQRRVAPAERSILVPVREDAAREVELRPQGEVADSRRSSRQSVLMLATTSRRARYSCVRSSDSKAAAAPGPEGGPAPPAPFPPAPAEPVAVRWRRSSARFTSAFPPGACASSSANFGSRACSRRAADTWKGTRDQPDPPPGRRRVVRLATGRGSA